MKLTERGDRKIRRRIEALPLRKRNRTTTKPGLTKARLANGDGYLYGPEVKLQGLVERAACDSFARGSDRDWINLISRS